MQQEIVDPSYEMEESLINNKLINQIKVYSNKELAEMKKLIINNKLIDHLDSVIKAFLKFYPDIEYPLKFYPDIEYPKDINTINDQLKYYNDTIRKKILNIDSNSDNSESNLGDIYNKKEKYNFIVKNPMLLSPP